MISIGRNPFYIIVDLYCHELNRVFEIDGSVHEKEDILRRDLKRQELIEDYGVKFLRFSNAEIKMDIINVLNRIGDWVDEFQKDHSTHL